MEQTARCRPARADDAEAVLALVRRTVEEVYPRYYPQGVADFFLLHHSGGSIMRDIAAGRMRVIEIGGRIVGTGSRDGNHITRVYVLPEFHGRGIGSRLMDALEAEIAREHGTALTDSSLPAAPFYERRGYRTVRHETQPCESGAVLVYEVMEKRLARTAEIKDAER